MCLVLNKAVRPAADPKQLFFPKDLLWQLCVIILDVFYVDVLDVENAGFALYSGVQLILQDHELPVCFLPVFENEATRQNILQQIAEGNFEILLPDLIVFRLIDREIFFIECVVLFHQLVVLGIYFVLFPAHDYQENGVAGEIAVEPDFDHPIDLVLEGEVHFVEQDFDLAINVVGVFFLLGVAHL